MKKETCDLKYSADALPPKTAILDITADGHYWRTSPLLALSIIKNENTLSDTTALSSESSDISDNSAQQNKNHKSTEETQDRDAHKRIDASLPDHSIGIPTHLHSSVEIVLTAEKESDEYDILLALPELLADTDEIITFNGNAFDIPFLRRKLNAYDLPDAFADMKTRDLMLDYRVVAQVLALPSKKLADFAEYIASHPGNRTFKNASVFQDDTRQTERRSRNLPEKAQETILPPDDAQRTLEILGFDAFCELLHGVFTFRTASLSGGLFVMELTTPHPAPCRISLHDAPFHLVFEENKVLLSSRMENGCIRFYHSDVKNYYYLPAEGFAVHKSVGTFVDPSHRQKAVRENCFTSLPVTEIFLQDRSQESAYAKSALQYISSVSRKQ